MQWRERSSITCDMQSQDCLALGGCHKDQARCWLHGHVAIDSVFAGVRFNAKGLHTHEGGQAYTVLQVSNGGKHSSS